MLFYILNVEQENNTTIVLYGIQLDSQSLKSTKITIKGIISPRILHSSNTDYIETFLKDISQKLGSDIKYDICTMHNYFCKTLPKDLNVYKIQNIKTNWNKLNSYTLLNTNMFSSPIEQFIIERKIKGPCVIKLNDVQEFGNDELVINDYNTIDFVKYDDPPPFILAIMNLEIVNKQVVSVCLKLVESKTDSYKCYLSTVQKQKTAFENIKNCNKKVFGTENEMKQFVNEIINKHRPSLLLTFNLHENYIREFNLKGIMHCDVFIFAQNVTKGKDYTLQELCTNLNIPYKKYTNEIENLYHSNDTIYKIYQSLDIFELSKQIGEVCGCLMQKVLNNNRAERIEYLLMHELYEGNCLFPEKSKRTADYTYTGGLVLTPAIGFYETLVLLLDFNSLYPSIIQEFNICFSTIGMHKVEESQSKNEDKDEIYKSLESKINEEKTGFLPKILSNLVKRRKAIKSSLFTAKTPKEYKTLDTRQKAIKLTANSIYGCLGCSFSRFSNYTMAGYITYKGRQILKATRFIAENDLKMKVIYGDTDSIMIDTMLQGININYDKAMSQSEELKRRVNSQYKSIEIEVEKVIKKLCLYTKKKYGCLSIDRKGNSTKEYKGLDFVRRDFASIATEISKEMFDILIMDLEKEYSKLYDAKDYKGFDENTFVTNNKNQILMDMIVNKLMSFKSSIERQPLDKFIVSTQLKRDPESYTNASGLLHVSLALRLNSTGSNYKKDDIISYYIGDNKNTNISQRTYHPSEFANVDYKYYIENQILPALNRIFNIYDGISSTDINNIFGIQKQYREIETKVKIATGCCNKLQVPAKKCENCDSEISDNYCQMKMLELLKAEVGKLYSTERRCVECGLISDNYFTHCFNCEKEMVEICKNKEFNTFLQSMIVSFREFEGIKKYLEELNRQNEYMRIDMKKYFLKEIVNALAPKKY